MTAQRGRKSLVSIPEAGPCSGAKKDRPQVAKVTAYKLLKKELGLFWFTKRSGSETKRSQEAISQEPFATQNA